MQKSRFLGLLVVVCLLAIIAVPAGAAPGPNGATVSVHGAPAVARPGQQQPGVVTLWDQYDNDSGNATSAQNIYDFGIVTDLADNFTVPASDVVWTVLQVDFMGIYWNGSGPSQYFTVTFYTNAGGHPGTQVWQATNLAYTTADQRNFTIYLPVAAVLPAGDYWMEIQSYMAFGSGGQWGWDDRTVQNGGMDAQWQNPDGYFGVCQTWGDRNTTCAIDPGVPDQVFRISGHTGTPTAVTLSEFSTQNGNNLPIALLPLAVLALLGAAAAFRYSRRAQ